VNTAKAPASKRAQDRKVGGESPRVVVADFINTVIVTVIVIVIIVIG